MRRLRALAYRFAGFLRKSAHEREMAEEFESHFEMHLADNIRAGMSPQEARRHANLKFGGVASVKESYRDRASLPFFDGLHQDVRYGMRQLSRNPGFTATAVLLLALGIGANAAIYSFLDAMLVRKLPVRDPGALVLLKWQVRGRAAVVKGLSGESHRDPQRGSVSGSLPYPYFESLRRNPVLSEVIGFSGGASVTLAVNGAAESVRAIFVSGEYFTGLGVSPAAGRLMAPADDQAALAPVAVLSHEYWQSTLGGNLAIVGAKVVINGKPVTIIGVAPPGFHGLNPSSSPQIYLSLRQIGALDARFRTNPEAPYQTPNLYWTEVMARLRVGVSRQQAESALAASFTAWVEGTITSPDQRKSLPKLFLLDGSSGLDRLRTYFGKPLYVLMGMAGLILAIACANVANLMLARAGARRREIAVRQGLGARPLRVVRQLLTESILLGVLGGIVGIAFASIGTRGLVLLMAAWQPDTQFHAELNWNVVVFAAALAITTSILFGLAPALMASRSQLAVGLKEGRAGALPRRGAQWLPSLGIRAPLVALQIALSLLLVSGAALFVRTLTNLANSNLGLNQRNLLLFEANARQAGYTDQTVANFYSQVLAGLQGAPGVQSASLSEYAMISGSRSGTRITVPGSTASPNRGGTAVAWVGPVFFTTMQTPLLMGRDVTERDIPSAPSVAIVNESFVAKYFAGVNPLGRTLEFFGETKPATIVGVVKDAPLTSFREEIEPVVFAPFLQHAERIDGMTFVVRTSGDPLGAIAIARRAMRAADPNVPLQQIRTQQAQIEQTTGQERLLATLCTAFAALALLIAVVGLYGTMVYNVGRRRSEFGIRMALGAQRAWIVQMVMREAVQIIAVGLLIGLPAAYFASTFVESFLYGVKPRDPLMFSVAVLVLSVAALVAAWLPARRASRIDPMAALRHE